MITLPRAMASHGDPIYRGLRDGSRSEDWSWWAEDRDYAQSYGGEVVEGRLPADATILDATQAIVDGWISGGSLDAIEPGLAAACGLDADSEVEADRLWDCCHDEHDGLAAFLIENGYDGIKWCEQDMRVAYLLIH